MALTYYEQLGNLARSPKVRAKLAEVADKLADRVRQLNDAEDAAEVFREDGTRPGAHSPTGLARAYARVGVEFSWEFGTAEQERQRLLGRAVAETIQ